MNICKNLNPFDTINTLDEWKTECPPQRKDLHWKDGRSAMETAKHWLHLIPKEFRDLLKCFNLYYERCSPEFVTKLDTYTGNGRNHDLLIIAHDGKKEDVVISIESKVDESFGKTIGGYYLEIEKKKQNGESTNADKRIELLRNAIFPKIKPETFKLLRYQLLIAIAGILIEAKRQRARKAIFLVQTFISENMSSKLHRQNQRDLDFFMELISDGNHCIVHDNDLFGPFLFAGNEFIPDDVELWIGKYSIRI